MPLRKSYTGFVLWMILFIAGMFAMAFIPTDNEALITRLIMNWCSLGISVLALMIYFNQAVYWYNGTSFAEAEAAGEERRKAFAFRHFLAFAVFALLFSIYSLLGQLCGFPVWLDLILGSVGLIGAAISTLRIKL